MFGSHFSLLLKNIVPIEGKREKASLAEVEKACLNKIALTEESLKKKKQASFNCYPINTASGTVK